MEKLTKGQKKALQAAKKGENVFISGGGGVGKSYVSRKIVEELQKARKNVLITASTGKAAMLIGGVTCHRAFQIPTRMAWEAKPKVLPDAPIYEADAVLIDEVSMLRIDAFEYIICAIEEVNNIRKSPEYLADPNNRYRNPVQIIVVGDFGQLPPVIMHPTDGSPDEGDLMSEYYGFPIGLGYAFEAPGWKKCNFVVCELQEVLRQSDRQMVEALQHIRFGDRSALKYFMENSRKEPFSDQEGVIYLCGKNRTAERINDVRVAKLKGKERVYDAEITGQITEQDKPAPDQLRLKKNVQVIMLQNSEKYRNGSSAIVTRLGIREITVKIEETGELVDVPYVNWNVERYVVKGKTVKKEVIGMYKQLPVRLGYAITIHKCQGQSLEKVALVLGSSDEIEDAQSTRPEIFAYGQLYVGLSRATSMEGLYIEGNLELVDKLAANEVLDFYGIDALPELPAKKEDCKKRIKKNACDVMPEPIKREEEENPRRRARKKDKEEGMAEIKCSEEMVRKVVWTFAHTLSKEAILKGSIILVPEKYEKQVRNFLKMIKG